MFAGAVVAADLRADRALGLGADRLALRLRGALDFAGGTVVHINAGIAGLVCALVLGKRVGYGTDNLAPFNLCLRVIGAVAAVGRLVRLQRAAPPWRANGRAGMAMAVTQIASAAAGARLDVRASGIAKGKPSVLALHLRCGGRSRRHHAGRPASCWALGRHDHRRGRRPGLLLGRDAA